MFKKILFSSLIPLSTLTVPMMVTSCALPTGEINKGQQGELLNSSKDTFLDEWLTNTFISLFVENTYANSGIEYKSKLIKSYKYFLDHLSWPTTTEEYQDVDQAKKTEFENLVKEAYKFYISFKSTIKESGEKPISPNVYFYQKAQTWKKDELNTINEIKDSNGKLLTINDFKPGVNYTGLDASKNIIENDYKILVQTRGTLVYQNIMKLLLSEMYFLKNNQTLIENGTNYKKMTKNQSSVDYINTKAYVEDNNFSNYMLKKYIIESNPHFMWSYGTEDYNNTTTVSSIISTLLEFNNLSISKDLTLSDILVPDSTESSANALSKLQSFNKLELATSSETGDLSSALDNMKMYGDSKIGLLDNDKKLLFTFTELNAIKEARKYNKSNSNALMIPSININAGGKTKNAYAITISDLDVSWGGATSSSTTTNSFTYTNGNVSQTLVINSISFTPSNGDKKVINVSFTYKFKTTTDGVEHSFNHNFEISNWGSNDSSPSNPFMNAFYFTGNEEQVGIKIFNESAATGINYYLRPLPLFNRTGAIVVGKERYMVGNWTFNNTPWNTVEKQKKLIYFFVLTDANLYSRMQDFYLFNNFNVEASTPELSTIISSLNLNKKTDADRRNEGIIF